METFHLMTSLLVLTAAFSFINHRYLRLQPSIGLMLGGMILSLGLIALGSFGLGIHHAAENFLGRIHFGNALLIWMLGFLLFAGALTVDGSELLQHWGATLLLATVGTALSMFLVAALAWSLLPWIHVPLPWTDCLLLGAILSPTDPVAVVAVMRHIGAPTGIRTVVAAESLFNDGVGVVLFLILIGGGHLSAGSVSRLFLQEAGGAVVLGLVTGALCLQLLRRCHDFQVEVLLTIALVMGACSAADRLHVSGPIAVVVAGLLIGNRGRITPLAEATPPSVRRDLEPFWELIEDTLNAALFLLLGMEMLVMKYTLPHFLAALICIPIVLLARWVSVSLAIGTLALRPGSNLPSISVLTWGGLRGGLAVAMALSIPTDLPVSRELIMTITYAVVAFSILVQGTTIKRVVTRSVAEKT